MKKKIFILTAFCICLSFIAGSCNEDDDSETPIDPPPSSGIHGAKLYTENGGANWDAASIFENFIITDICSFTNEINSFSIILESKTNAYNRIMKTTDFGANWTETHLNNNKLNDIISTGNGKGFVVGNNNTLLMTTDYGLTWTQVIDIFNNNLAAIDFANEMRGIIISKDSQGEDNGVLMTTNGGLNWTSQSAVVNGSNMMDIIFINSTEGVACGENGEKVYHYGKIARTTNSGISWDTVPCPTTQELVSVDFLGDVGIIVGKDGAILRSADGGRTWLTVSGISSELRKVYIDPGLNYWAVGGELSNSGVVLKSTNQGVDWNTVFSVSSYQFYDVFIIKDAGFVVGSID